MHEQTHPLTHIHTQTAPLVVNYYIINIQTPSCVTSQQDIAMNYFDNTNQYKFI